MDRIAPARRPRAQPFEARYEIGAPRPRSEVGTLQHFLTERLAAAGLPSDGWRTPDYLSPGVDVDVCVGNHEFNSFRLKELPISKMVFSCLSP
jgi:hypothetical protein